MSAAAVDPASATELYGQDVGDALAGGYDRHEHDVGRPVRRRRSGDVVRAAPVERRRPEPAVGSAPSWTTPSCPAELVLSVTRAADIGFVRPTSVQIYGYPSDQADRRRARRPTGCRARTCASAARGGGGPTPDATLDLAETKAKLGQFWYIPHAATAR